MAVRACAWFFRALPVRLWIVYGRGVLSAFGRLPFWKAMYSSVFYDIFAYFYCAAEWEGACMVPKSVGGVRKTVRSRMYCGLQIRGVCDFLRSSRAL